MRERPTVRVLLLDPQDRILLLRGRLPGDRAGPGAWFTVGGGVEPGETLERAAAREIAEETGFTDVSIGPLLWAGQWVHDRPDGPVLFLESFVAARCASGEPDRSGWQAHEHDLIDDIRWWTLAELRAPDEPVFPTDLAPRLAAVLAR